MSIQQKNIVNFIISLGLLISCSEDQSNTEMKSQTETSQPVLVENNSAVIIPAENNSVPVEKPNKRFEIDNKHYMFDVTNHSVEELRELLERIEEITEASPEAFDNLKMVMVLHGPDINLFTQENYIENKSIVDLAAKLDAFDIVDMKVCETSIDTLGFDRNDIPAFIESVPYAPDTIQSLKQQGYINL